VDSGCDDVLRVMRDDLMVEARMVGLELGIMEFGIIPLDLISRTCWLTTEGIEPSALLRCCSLKTDSSRFPFLFSYGTYLISSQYPSQVKILQHRQYSSKSGALIDCYCLYQLQHLYLQQFSQLLYRNAKDTPKRSLIGFSSWHPSPPSQPASQPLLSSSARPA